MKTIHAGLALFSCLATAGALSAQTVQFVSVTFQTQYVQTGATGSDLSIASGTPYVFRAAVETGNSSTSTSPLTAANFTRPAGGSPIALSFDSVEHTWQFSDSYSTSGGMTAVYGTGTYGFSVTPTDSANILASSSTSSFLQVPLLTLSGGSWVGSNYVITDTSSLSISFNPVYTGSPGATAGFHYDADINGSNSTPAGQNDFINYDPTTASAAANASTPPTWLVGTLQAGSYTIQVNYDDIQNPGTVMGSAFGAALVEYRTSVNLTVVPEPSATVLLAGLAALLGAAVIRRHRPA
jgi:hypothetical protein